MSVKNKNAFVVIFVVFVLAVLVVLCLALIPKLEVNYECAVKMSFHYDGSQIEKVFSDSDSSSIQKLLDGKVLKNDNPSCGFSEGIAITLNDSDILCIARDGCPILFFEIEGKI